MNYLILIIGFVLLIKGADFFVDGACFVAKKFRIPSMIVGMTIVAIGTSLPEITISALAAFRGENGMAVGNILGSNILNICIILGIIGVMHAVPVQKDTVNVDIPFLIVLEALLLAECAIGMTLSRIDGVIIGALFVLFVLYMIHQAKKGSAEEVEVKELKIWQMILYLVGGCLAIKFGGDFVVESATAIADQLGMSKNLIGLTVVALGTSLPELVTSVVAARKGNVQLALGNCIGSDIFNILLALSTASIIRPIEITSENIIDCGCLIVITILTLILAKLHKNIERRDAALLLCCYAGYFVYIAMR
ncbi:MAG: calcium/sodium antiporter [Oscillospiraceae bacterium]|nr:calcium/sodium antiporter [Oscillospiraceae bacterium]